MGALAGVRCLGNWGAPQPKATREKGRGGSSGAHQGSNSSCVAVRGVDGGDRRWRWGGVRGGVDAGVEVGDCGFWGVPGHRAVLLLRLAEAERRRNSGTPVAQGISARRSCGGVSGPRRWGCRGDRWARGGGFKEGGTVIAAWAPGRSSRGSRPGSVSPGESGSSTGFC